VIEGISVDGNSKSGDYVVFENLPYTVGDTVSEAEIRAGLEHLQSLEIFSEIVLNPLPGSEAGRLQLVFRVTERYWPHFRFKGGFSELDGWYITPISLNLDNVLGMGNFTSLGFTIGDRVGKAGLDYLNPNIFDSGFDFLLGISGGSQEILHYRDKEGLVQRIEFGGYEFGIRSRENFYKYFTFSLTGNTSTPDSFATKGKEKIYDLPVNVLHYSFKKINTAGFLISFNMDQRDQHFYPTTGWWAGFRYYQTDKAFKSDVNFSRVIADLRWYYNAFAHVVLATRLKYGAVSSTAPFWEKFYLGGPNSLRGYDDRSLSPAGGGDRLYQAGMELRFPIGIKQFPKHLLSGVVFYDAGANLSINQELNYNTIFQGAGFGLRFRLPYMGIIRMDMAYPLETGVKQVQLSLGHTF
jgi:outer membrane protein insertion porin family